MLRRSLESLVNRDIVMATAVCEADDDVDALYEQVYHELIMFMVSDPKTIQRATYLLWVAHDLERIADRATKYRREGDLPGHGQAHRDQRLAVLV